MTFDTAEDALKYFTEKKTAYQLAFGEGTPHGKAVLADLEDACCVYRTCIVPGDRDATHVLEGRRQVYLRIRNFLHLTPEELVALATRPAQGATSHARTDSPA